MKTYQQRFILPTSPVVAICLSLVPLNVDAKEPYVEDFDRLRNKLHSNQKATLAKLNSQYLQALKKLKIAYTKQGDIENAIKVKHRIRDVSQLNIQDKGILTKNQPPRTNIANSGFIGYMYDLGHQRLFQFEKSGAVSAFHEYKSRDEDGKSTTYVGEIKGNWVENNGVISTSDLHSYLYTFAKKRDSNSVSVKRQYTTNRIEPSTRVWNYIAIPPKSEMRLAKRGSSISSMKEASRIAGSWIRADKGVATFQKNGIYRTHNVIAKWSLKKGKIVVNLDNTTLTINNLKNPNCMDVSVKGKNKKQEGIWLKIPQVK